MTSFQNAQGKSIIMGLTEIINQNRAYLSQIDGLIGDGDHGINMSKGFSIFADKARDADMDFSTALRTLSRTLLGDIGGSMGPLYGTFFGEMAKQTRGIETIDGAVVGAMLRAALDGIIALGNAQVGDKTMVDTLLPAVEAYESAMANGENLNVALARMKEAATAGRDSTHDLVAKIGRASRLGERSRGVLDAGAVSCCLLLHALADGILQLTQTS